MAVIIALVCFFVVYNLPASSVSSENKNWLSGWDYRKSHDIQGSPGAGVDYQTKIIVHYPKGDCTGSNVYLESKCKKNFDDVRFTAADGITVLDFWRETKTDADYAVFWVGFANIYNDSDNTGGRIDEFPNYFTASQEAGDYAWSLRTRAYSNTSRLDLSNNKPAVATFSTYEIQRDGLTNVKLTCNDVLQGSLNTNIPTINMGAMFSADNGGSNLYSVTVTDWVIIRKYVANEPLQGTWGIQESLLSSNYFGISFQK